MKPFSVEIYSDIVCPWCYIGKRNIEAGLAYYRQTYPNERQPEVRWMPFQLQAALPPEGVDRVEYMKRRFPGQARPEEAFASVIRAGAKLDLEYRFDRIKVQPNTINAHRLTRYAARHGLEDQMMERLFEAFFRNGENVADKAVLCDIGVELGLERDALTAYMESDLDADWVREADARAKRIGVTTVPFLVLNDRKGASAIQKPDDILSVLRWARRDAARPTWLPKLFGRRF